MADEAEQPDAPAAAEEEAGGDAAAKRRWWKRIDWNVLFTPRALIILLAASLLGHGVAYYWTGAYLHDEEVQTAELPLGRFAFQDHGPSHSPITGAQFQLHVSLLPGVERSARARLGDVKYRVQQSIEELLRRAKGGDFEDPGLEELKRQLQEQVNTTLGLRAIDEVIVTELKLDRVDDAAPDAQSEVVDQRRNAPDRAKTTAVQPSA